MNSIQGTTGTQDAGKIAKTVGYFAAFVALGLTSATMGPTLSGLAAHTHTTLGEVSILFTARSLGYMLGSLRGGRWYDRFRGHQVQALMLLGMAALMALVPVIPLIGILGIVLIGLGFAEGTLDVGGNTLLVWVHGDKVGPFMNGLHFFFGIGAFLSPVIIAQAVLISGDITWGYWAVALLLLPVAVWLVRQPSPPIPAGSQDGKDVRVKSSLIGLVMAFFFLVVGAEGSFGGWIFTYARALNLGTVTTAAYLTSAFWGALTVGRLLAIPIAIRVHPRWMLLGDLLGCLASLGLILLGQASYVALWIGACGFGLFMGPIFPATMSLAGRSLPINGRITGWFFVGASAGGMFFPWLIGQLFEPAGPQVVMLVIMAAILCGFAVLAGLALRLNQPVMEGE